MESAHYTLAEVANKFRVSTRTVHNWIKAEKLHPVRIGRGKYLFPKSEVDDLLKR